MKDIFKVLSFTKELRKYYIVIAGLNIFISLLAILWPYLSGRAIDELKKGSDIDQQFLIIIAVLIFSMDLLQNLVGNIVGYIGDQMNVKLYNLLASRYYNHLLALPQKYFDDELSGKIINRLNRSINQIAQFMQMMSNNFLTFIFTTFLSLAIVYRYSWLVGILLTTLYPIFIWLTIRTSSKWQDYQIKKNNHIDIASGRFAESVNQIKVVRSYLQEKSELKFFNNHLKKVLQLNRPQSKYWHWQDVKRKLILNIIFFAVYVIIFIQASNGELTPGQAVALILFSFNIRIPIFTISFLVENTQRMITDTRDYFQVMSLAADQSDSDKGNELTVKSGGIMFKNVDFGYSDEQQILKDLTFEIKPGTKVALVGESGEGKTTITNLILRFYRPSSGQILIDDQDISQISQSSLRSNISCVFQDPSLFSGTIRQNISYGRPQATEDEIIKSAKDANAHDFISKLPDGYDTEIGERGLKLSGGQKQRISIARALLKDSPILILDEATSSLDSKSESAVQQALQTLMRSRTTIIIAHRLSTIANVDTVITLRRGQVDEIGSPKELSNSGGIYAELLKIQNSSPKTKLQTLKKYDIN